MRRKKPNNDYLVAWFLFAMVAFVLVLLVFLLNKKVLGQEELMVCNDCKKTIEMDYQDDMIKSINLKYEW